MAILYVASVMQASGSLKSGQTISSGSTNDNDEYKTPLASVAASKSVAGSSQFKSVASFGTTQQQIFSDIGYFRGVLVALKHIRKEHIQLSRNVLLEFNEVRHIRSCDGKNYSQVTEFTLLKVVAESHSSLKCIV